MYRQRYKLSKRKQANVNILTFAVARDQSAGNRSRPVHGEAFGEMSFEAGAGFDASVESLRVVILETSFSARQGVPRLRQVVDEDFTQFRPRGRKSLRVDLRGADPVAGA